MLTRLADLYPHRLLEIDITTDVMIHTRYVLTIPVVKVNNQELQAPISFSQLSQLLAEATYSDCT